MIVPIWRTPRLYGASSAALYPMGDRGAVDALLPALARPSGHDPCGYGQLAIPPQAKALLYQRSRSRLLPTNAMALPQLASLSPDEGSCVFNVLLKDLNATTVV